MSIKQRITIGFGLLVAALLLLFSFFIYQTYESYRQSLMRNRLQRRALAGQLYFQNRLEFHRSSYLTLPDQHEYLVNSSNRIIYQSSGSEDYKLTTNLLTEARQQEVYFNYTTKPLKSQKEGIALAFKVGGQQYVSIVTAHDVTGLQASESLFFILASGNVILLLIVSAAGFWFARGAMRPFDELIRQMNPDAVNDFSFRLHGSTRQDEAGYLASSFNELLGRLQNLAVSQEHFVSYASHEIRTPLTVVKGILETSLAYDKNIADVQQSLEKALVRLEGAIELANSLLRLAEIEGLQSDRLKEDINIVDTVLDTISYFGEKYPQQRINFQVTDTFTEYSSRIRVLGNITLLRTVLINILDNASKYSDQKTIDLEVDFEPSWVNIRIKDQGIGIPASQLGDVFLPMMRAGNVRNIPGSGLGLTLAKRIIDLHAGRLHATSQSGLGTNISITLPVLLLEE
jgi:two-component system sensor histidine kinase ArlS